MTHVARWRNSGRRFQEDTTNPSHLSRMLPNLAHKTRGASVFYATDFSIRGFFSPPVQNDGQLNDSCYCHLEVNADFTNNMHYSTLSFTSFSSDFELPDNLFGDDDILVLFGNFTQVNLIAWVIEFFAVQDHPYSPQVGASCQ